MGSVKQHKAQVRAKNRYWNLIYPIKISLASEQSHSVEDKANL